MRHATADDMPRLVDMGRRFHGAGSLTAPFEPDGLAAFLQALMDAPSACVIVSDSGVIGGVLSPAYVGPSWMMAVELFWWADKGGLGLLRAFEDWAREHGAQEVRMTTLCSLPRADAVLRHKGYSPAEISYSKVI